MRDPGQRLGDADIVGRHRAAGGGQGRVVSFQARPYCDPGTFSCDPAADLSQSEASNGALASGADSHDLGPAADPAGQAAKTRHLTPRDSSNPPLSRLDGHPTEGKAGRSGHAGVVNRLRIVTRRSITWPSCRSSEKRVAQPASYAAARIQRVI